MRTLLISLGILGLLLATACKSDKGDTAETDTNDTDTNDTDVAGGFTVSGNAVNLLTGKAATEGLCVAAADPTAAISGGELTVLGSSTIGAAGAYSVANITTTSTVGLLMLVQDCADEGTVMPTATGIGTSDYAKLGDGDVLPNKTIYSIDATTQGTFQALLGAAGYAGDLGVDGALVGFVMDAAGNPIDGAVVSGGSSTVYYFTGKDFSAAATVGAARAMFVIPGAPIYSYSCTAKGQTFDSLLAGSQPGYAVIVSFNAL